MGAHEPSTEDDAAECAADAGAIRDTEGEASSGAPHNTTSPVEDASDAHTGPDPEGTAGVDVETNAEADPEADRDAVVDPELASSKTPAEDGFAMGMDIGTTHSAVAVINESGDVDVVKANNYNNGFFPSTVTINNHTIDNDNNDNWQVGTYDDQTYPPDGYCHVKNVKFVIGRNTSDGKLKSDKERLKLGCEFDEHGQPFYEIYNQIVRPIEIVALQIRWAQKLVQQQTGKTPERCVLTVPAYFTDAQRQATLQAAEIAGVKVKRLLNEPTAAAIVALKGKKDGLYLVPDIGGGTTDVSVIKAYTSPQGKRSYIVRVTSGDNALGGQHITHVLCDLFRKQYGKAAQGLSELEIWNACEVAKQRSESPLRILARGQEYRISKDRYRTALAPYWRKVEELIREARGAHKVDGVILAGGASLHDLFKELVTRQLPGAPLLSVSSPAEVVAVGAAIMTKADAPVVTDVLPRSIGIEAQIPDKDQHGVMIPILERNETLPTSRTFEFTGVADVAEIDLYEGESEKAHENIKLGQCVLTDTKGKKIFVRIRATRDAVIELYSWKAGEDEPGEPNIKLTRAKSDLTAEMVEAMRTELDRRLPLAPLVSQSSALNKRKRSSGPVGGRKRTKKAKKAKK